MPELSYIKRIVKSEQNLVNMLNKIQDKHGYISEHALKIVSKETGIPLARIYSTASFYSFLRFKKQGKRTIRLCNSPSCYLNNSTNILKIIKKLTKLNPGQSNAKFNFELTSCIGCCNKAPAMMLDNKVYGNLTEEKIKKLLKKC